MVNFYIKIDGSHDVDVDPALDLLDLGGIFDASDVNVLFEINLTESQARIFQFKLLEGSTDDISNLADVKFRYKHNGDSFQNWPIFLNHWHNWEDKKLLSGATNKRTDQAMANTLAKEILGLSADQSIPYNTLFENSDDILAQCGRALNDGLRNIRVKLNSAATTLTKDGSNNGAEDGLSPYSDTSGNSIPEYIFQKLFLEADGGQKERFLSTNLKNPSLLSDINASNTSCFTVDNSYNEWVNLPLHNGDAFFIDYQASVEVATLTNITTNTIVKNTTHNNGKSVIKINIISDQTTYAEKTKSDFLDNSSDLHTMANYNSISNSNYKYDSSNSYVGPHKDENDKMVFYTQFAAAHYTDGTNNGTKAKNLGTNSNKYYINSNDGSDENTYNASLNPNNEINDAKII
jgi:hypothetical protein